MILEATLPMSVAVNPGTTTTAKPTVHPAAAHTQPLNIRPVALHRLHTTLRARTRLASPAGSAQPQRLVTVPNPTGGPDFSFQLPSSAGVPSSAVYQVLLKKPLGLTLQEQAGRILVENVAPGGHAAKAGVAAGDALLATTARAQTSAGVNQLVLLQTAGQSFKTVAAALRSNTCAQCPIALVLQRSG